MKKQIPVLPMSALAECSEEELMDAVRTVRERENLSVPYFVKIGRMTFDLKNPPDFFEALEDRQLCLRLW
jgi:hypothetical protein